VLLLAIAPSAMLSAAPKMPKDESGGAAMQTFPTRYYIIHTDIDTDDVKEAVIRMTKMAEEYHARTQGFSGDIRERLPFYMFRTSAEYYKAGGLPGSAGVFNGSALMAIAGDETNGQTWHIVQHEGFHQFAHAVIRGELPTWLNEGIAEFFGESLFTGDGFVTGIIPPGRLKRVQEEITSGHAKSIKQMMFTSQAEWNSRLAIENYDQAWSMVHFLALGENGRYQEAFVNFMKMIGGGTPWPNAWQKCFGDATGFEQRWKDYWTNLPPNPTADLYAQAVTATFTSFLARSATQKHPYGNFDEFLSAAQAGNVKTGDTIDDWLPPKLLKDAADAAAGSHVKWTIEPAVPKGTQLVAVLPDGNRIVGSYLLTGGKITHVGVEVDDTGAVLKQAEALIADGKKSDARTLLQKTLRNHPKSPMIEQVRQMMAQTK
jgi:hypothetical protein